MAKNDNIEVLVVEWLKTLGFTDYSLSGDKPKDTPDKYILVDRTGGPREAMVLDRAEILIEVYNVSSRLDASNVANQIGDRAIELVSFNDDITHSSVNSIVNLDDLTGQFHRYQVYLDVYHRR